MTETRREFIFRLPPVALGIGTLLLASCNKLPTPRIVDFDQLVQNPCSYVGKGIIKVEGFITFSRSNQDFSNALSARYDKDLGNKRIWEYMVYEQPDINSPGIFSVYLADKPLEAVKVKEDAFKRKLLISGQIDQVMVGQNSSECIFNISSAN